MNNTKILRCTDEERERLQVKHLFTFSAEQDYYLKMIANREKTSLVWVVREGLNRFINSWLLENGLDGESNA